LGDRVDRSTDLMDDGCEAGGVVLSEALVIIEELDIVMIKSVGWLSCDVACLPAWDQEPRVLPGCLAVG
jgi:hypothetical protein